MNKFSIKISVKKKNIIGSPLFNEECKNARREIKEVREGPQRNGKNKEVQSPN